MIGVFGRNRPRGGYVMLFGIVLMLVGAWLVMSAETQARNAIVEAERAATLETEARRSELLRPGMSLQDRAAAAAREAVRSRLPSPMAIGLRATIETQRWQRLMLGGAVSFVGLLFVLFGYVVRAIWFVGQEPRPVAARMPAGEATAPDGRID